MKQSEITKIVLENQQGSLNREENNTTSRQTKRHSPINIKCRKPDNTK